MSENLSAVNSKSESNLPKVIWRVEILNAADGNGEISKVTWRIQNFSSFKNGQSLCSENFSVDGNKWNIDIYPKGDNNNLDHLSIYLDVADSATLPSGWTRFARFGFAVIDQIDRRNSITKAMEESIKELAGQADKAKQDKNHLTEKESIKLTLTVEEAEKKRENMLGEREGIFKSSKEMKVELDALGKEWSEYEANAKVAEEVEKTVEAEWGRMKCFISAIKQKI
ncbi:hypothetical protein V6N11_054164 [Hibiscus sabdariffa]|uniref:MATH domain-containing protein n=1 Tax=Hibiscus sabdariffa TaxID=183260 RepID=A0ABR2S308_9ROSI